jgi:hypothetical protein
MSLVPSRGNNRSSDSGRGRRGGFDSQIDQTYSRVAFLAASSFVLPDPGRTADFGEHDGSQVWTRQCSKSPMSYGWKSK